MHSLKRFRPKKIAAHEKKRKKGWATLIHFVGWLTGSQRVLRERKKKREVGLEHNAGNHCTTTSLSPGPSLWRLAPGIHVNPVWTNSRGPVPAPGAGPCRAAAGAPRPWCSGPGGSSCPATPAAPSAAHPPGPPAAAHRKDGGYRIKSINNLCFPSRDTEVSLIYSENGHTLNTITRITF